MIERDELKIVQTNLSDYEFKGSLLSSEEHVAWLNALNSPQKFYHYSQEIVSVFNLCIYLHRQSCLSHGINNNIMKLSNSGLLDSWVKGFVDKSFLKRQINQEPRQMDNFKLRGAYKLLIFGFFTSWIVLLLELISVRIKFLHRIMRFL